MSDMATLPWTPWHQVVQLRDDLRQALSIPDQYQILLVVALGKPAERVVLDQVGEDGEIKYWRDQGGVHHVPKRGLDDLILDL